MADREKLIDLLLSVPSAEVIFGKREGKRYTTAWHIANHLIANGVTVRERGRWEYHGGDDDMNLYGFCPKCHANWDEEIMEKYNFCPNCGADMRGRKTAAALDY